MKKHMRKSVSFLILAMLASAVAVGCSENSKMPDMYIQPAVLTKEEANIAKFYEGNTKAKIFDFVLDDSVQHIQVNTYRLQDGDWESISGGGGMTFEAPRGRLALEIDKLPEGMRIAIQSGDHTNGSSYETGEQEEWENMGYTTSWLSEQAEILYEKEIPMVIQIFTSKNEVRTYGVEYFEQPEKYEEMGYEGVFAVTVKFSQKPVEAYPGIPVDSGSTVDLASPVDLSSPAEVTENFFRAFEVADYDTMREYCTESCVETYFHDGDVNGMIRAKLTECGEEERIDEDTVRIFTTVEMETSKTSALYPETETSFYVELAEQDGVWLINGFPTG